MTAARPTACAGARHDFHFLLDESELALTTKVTASRRNRLMETLDMAATDGTLVLGVLNGDRSAFAELYDRHARLILAVCYDLTRDREAAEELTQEVFVRAFEKLGSLRDPQRFAPWLVGIARRTGREWRRRRYRDRQRLAPLPDPEAVADRSGRPDARLSTLRDAIASMPERERLALHVFYLHGLNAEQARTVLGLSKSGLYRVVACARQRLKRLMTREVPR